MPLRRPKLAASLEGQCPEPQVHDFKPGALAVGKVENLFGPTLCRFGSPANFREFRFCRLAGAFERNRGIDFPHGSAGGAKIFYLSLTRREDQAAGEGNYRLRRVSIQFPFFGSPSFPRANPPLDLLWKCSPVFGAWTSSTLGGRTCPSRPKKSPASSRRDRFCCRLANFGPDRILVLGSLRTFYTKIVPFKRAISSSHSRRRNRQVASVAVCLDSEERQNETHLSSQCEPGPSGPGAQSWLLPAGL